MFFTYILVILLSPGISAPQLMLVHLRVQVMSQKTSKPIVAIRASFVISCVTSRVEATDAKVLAIRIIPATVVLIVGDSILFNLLKVKLSKKTFLYEEILYLLRHKIGDS